jgi:hypothetical protein
MQAVFIRRTINSHRFDTHFLTGAYDTQGNLSTVGDQYFFKHWSYISCQQPVVQLLVTGADIIFGTVTNGL